MPRNEESEPTREPARGARRIAVDAWEAVVRQELFRARRRREPRFLRDAGVDHVLPALRSTRADASPEERG